MNLQIYSSYTVCKHFSLASVPTETSCQFMKAACDNWTDIYSPVAC